MSELAYITMNGNTKGKEEAYVVVSELAHITMNGNTKGKEKAYVVVGVSVYYCRKG